MRSRVRGEAALRFPRAGVNVTSCLLAGLMLAALTATSCARGGRAGVRRDEVRVQVANVGPDQSSGAYYVLLADEAGKRALPILVGENEALAISLQLKGVKTERPLTYQLLRNVIEQTGNRVDRVVINDVRDQVYYAKIYLNRGKYSIDSRPSDAIALAMGANAPIYVADKLFEASNLPGGGVTAAATASGLGVTVQELSPELALYFQVQPGSGLLVADVAEAAAKSGLTRGDIVTEVESQPVRTLADFKQRITQIKQDSSVTLTVRRGSEMRAITIMPQASASQGP
jgi:bifunctional DNase/RNase